MTQLDRLYDSLSRYQWWRRRIVFARPGVGLEMHKRLTDPPADARGPGAGTAALHDWLFQLAEAQNNARVLDIGCGFGATLLSWARRQPGRYVGLSLSPYQIAKAQNEARRLGVQDACEFRLQSYQDPIEGPFDVAISVESLFHAPDLNAALRRVHGALRAGGRLVLVEDMATDPAVAASEDARTLLERWVTTRLYSVAEFRAALADAGFAIVGEHDLSPQVIHGEPGHLERRWRRLERLQRVAPFAGARRVLDAFLGGIALERLYSSGSMSYRAMLATRNPEAA